MYNPIIGKLVLLLKTVHQGRNAIMARKCWHLTVQNIFQGRLNLISQGEELIFSDTFTIPNNC